MKHNSLVSRGSLAQESKTDEEFTRQMKINLRNCRTQIKKIEEENLLLHDKIYHFENELIPSKDDSIQGLKNTELNLIAIKEELIDRIEELNKENDAYKV